MGEVLTNGPGAWRPTPQRPQPPTWHARQAGLTLKILVEGDPPCSTHYEGFDRGVRTGDRRFNADGRASSSIVGIIYFFLLVPTQERSAQFGCPVARRLFTPDSTAWKAAHPAVAEAPGGWAKSRASDNRDELGRKKN